MQVEIKIEESCREPKVWILTDHETDELRALAQKIAAEGSPELIGKREDRAELLAPEKIIRVYSSNGKVFAETEAGAYSLRLRLYEAEEKLSGQDFARISSSELVNLKKVRGFDLSLAGTIRVFLSNGSVAYVSRRSVSKIKKRLGL